MRKIIHKVLVTGGAGFIGSNFVRHLVNKYPQYKIINLDNLSYAGNLSNLADLKRSKNYSFIKGDICNSALVDRIIKDCDMVVNFAAETHVDRSILSCDSFINTNIYGTNQLLKSSLKHGIRKFIHISTDEVYGSRLKGSFKETDILNPTNPYSSSKAAADLLVLSYFKTYSLPVVITRSSNNFGPYQYPEKLIPFFITNALENKPLPLYGDGLNMRDWLFVLDNVKGIDLVLHKGKAGQVYNIGIDGQKTNKEIAHRILKFMKKPESLITYIKDRPAHDRRYAINSSKLRSLGWKPETSFEASLKETVEWYLDNSIWWQKIKNRKEFKDHYRDWYLKRK